MSLTLDITPEERRTMLKDAAQILAEKLYIENHESMVISKSRAAGLLDVDARTLEEMGLPRVVLTGKLHKYALADIRQFIADRREK